MKYQIFIKNTDSMFAESDDLETAINEAKKNYLDKYPDEGGVDSIEWSVLETATNELEG